MWKKKKNTHTNNFLDNPIHVKRDFAGVITWIDLKIERSP